MSDLNNCLRKYSAGFQPLSISRPIPGFERIKKNRVEKTAFIYRLRIANGLKSIFKKQSRETLNGLSQYALLLGTGANIATILKRVLSIASLRS